MLDSPIDMSSNKELPQARRQQSEFLDQQIIYQGLEHIILFIPTNAQPNVCLYNVVFSLSLHNIWVQNVNQLKFETSIIR